MDHENARDLFVLGHLFAVAGVFLWTLSFVYPNSPIAHVLSWLVNGLVAGGFVLIVVGAYFLSQHYERTRIFYYFLAGTVLVVMAFAVFSLMPPQPTQADGLWETLWAGFLYFGRVAALFMWWVVLFVSAIYLFKRGYSELAELGSSKTLNTAGILVWIGGWTLPLVVGIVPILVGLILAGVGALELAPRQSAVSARGAFLLLPDGRQVELTNDVVLGRAWVASIFPNAPWLDKIAEAHVVIRQRPDGWYVADLGSETGTYVNGRDIRGVGEVRLRSGDVISLGWVFAVVFYEEPPPRGRRFETGGEDKIYTAVLLILVGVATLQLYL